MNPTEDQLREAWRNSVTNRSRTGCPASGALAELAFTGDGDLELREHVSNCGECADEVRAVRGAAEGAGQIPSRPARPSMRMQDLAIAALLVLTLGLGGWSFLQLDRTAELQKTIAALQRNPHRPAPVQSAPAPVPLPRAHTNVPIIDLEPAGDRTRGGEAPGAVSLPVADAYTLVMTIDPVRRHEGYSLHIVEQRGALAFSADDLRRSEHDTFTLTFEKVLLRPGLHRVELFGVDGSKRTKLASYSMLVP
jgi:hypothetical protein